MSCTNGSRKRAGGRDYINTNEIGVLCALFDLEGVLCRLLDLIPEAIQKIASLKFDKDETLDFLEEMLKKTAKRTVGLIYDELVNGIEMGAFCELEPPPLPEPVSFSDVFIFMAELVPILGYFFTANEILTGESTQLLDKIVGFWLRKQWYENCECIPDEPPTEPPPAPPTEPPLDIPDCGDNCPPRPCTTSVTICNGFFSNGQPIRPRSSCYGFRRVTAVTPPTQIEQGWTVAYIGANQVDIPQNDVLPIAESFTDVMGYRKLPLFANFGDGWFEVSEPPAFSGYIAPCPPCFDEEIEGTKEFCALFPDDPICLPDGDNEGDCGIEYVFVEEFVDCGLPTRTVRFELTVNGRDVPVTVSEFSECDSDRTNKDVVLLECINGVDIFGCTDPEATNYNPDATINNGTCEYPEINYGCTDPEALNYNPDAVEDDGSCIYEVYGCTDPAALNYDPAATSDDGSCEYEDNNIYGCQDPLASNYNPDATADDGSCEYPPELFGCINPIAINYNPDAVLDDGSCIYPEGTFGCRDPLAINYNPDSIYDDGSCIYE